jgi:uncharacterized protein involved in type VI secretion and phage assembly
MSQPVGVLSPSITLNGRPTPQVVLDNVVSVRVQRSLRLPSRMTIRLVDASLEASLAEHFKIGTEISLTIPEDGKLMTGHVTGMSLAMTEDEVPQLTVVADDLGYLLGRQVKVRTFLNMTWADVVNQIASGVGLAVVADSTTEVNPYVLQADTDLAFLDQIADRIGYDWWIDGKTLYFKRPSASNPTSLTLGVGGMTEFAVRGSGLHPIQAKVTGWNPKDQRMISGSAAVRDASVKPNSIFADGFLNPVQGLSASEVTVGALSPTTQSEANTLARSLAQQWVSGSVEARGTCQTKSSLTPGSPIKVSNAGSLSGTYHLTEVEHCWDDEGLRTHFVAGSRGPSGLADTLTGGAPRTGSFHIPGLMPALVTNNVDPDDLGRVRVKYSGISDEVEGFWARVVILGGGVDRGVIFEPEVDDEVLIGFEGGDPRKPVVIGGLYSAKNKMPAWAGGSNRSGGKVISRKIASRSGHQILFADGAASTEQYLLVQHRSGTQKVKLNSNGIEIESAAGNPITVKSGSAQLQIDGSGNIALKGLKVTIEGETEVVITAPQVKVNGKAQVEVAGPMVSVKGEATTQVQANGILTLKGGMVAIN